MTPDEDYLQLIAKINELVREAEKEQLKAMIKSYYRTTHMSFIRFLAYQTAFLAAALLSFAIYFYITVK